MITLGKIKKLTDLKWLNLFGVDYKTRAGKDGTWTFASRKSDPQPGLGPITSDAVVIIPIHKNQWPPKDSLVVIKEFRIPLGDYEYGFPAGLFDQNETAEDVARRELKEETGLDITKIFYVGPPCVSSAGLSDEAVTYVVCECAGNISTDGNEGTEDITVELLDLDGIRKLRNSGEKISAKTLPFLLMFEGMNRLSWPVHLEN